MYQLDERQNKKFALFLNKIKKLGVFLIVWKADKKTCREITEQGHIKHIIT